MPGGGICQIDSFFDVFVELTDLPGPLLSGTFRVEASVPGIFDLPTVNFGAGWKNDEGGANWPPDPPGPDPAPATVPLDPMTGWIVSQSESSGGTTGTHFVTLGLHVAPDAPPGDYWINLAEQSSFSMDVWDGSDWIPTDVYPAREAYLVTIVPVPAAGLLVLLGLGTFVWLRRRFAA